jgi:hypothetical protein
MLAADSPDLKTVALNAHRCEAGSENSGGTPYLFEKTSFFEIGAEILLRISREFDKSLEWLLTGEGSRFES